MGSEFSMTVKRTVAEGDQVWVWSILKGTGIEIEMVDILTFEDGLIREKYAVTQAGIQDWIINLADYTAEKNNNV